MYKVKKKMYKNTKKISPEKWTKSVYREKNHESGFCMENEKTRQTTKRPPALDKKLDKKNIRKNRQKSRLDTIENVLAIYTQ